MRKLFSIVLVITILISNAFCLASCKEKPNVYLNPEDLVIAYINGDDVYDSYVSVHTNTNSIVRSIRRGIYIESHSPTQKYDIHIELLDTAPVEIGSDVIVHVESVYMDRFSTQYDTVVILGRINK